MIDGISLTKFCNDIRTLDETTLRVIKCRKITHVKCGRDREKENISLKIFITVPTKIWNWECSSKILQSSTRTDIIG